MVGGDDDPREGQETGQAPSRPGLSGVEAARRAVRRVHQLTGMEPEGVTWLEPTDHGWRVGVEVVEMERIPDSIDVLAIYEVELDQHGRLASYRRTERYYRGRVDNNGR